MHSGFKGTRLGLTELLLKDNRIDYEITFVDSEGVVHGRMRHSYSLIMDSEVNTKVDALVTALLYETAKVHFVSPSGAVSDLGVGGGGAGGLAEAMGAAPGAADEPEGTPG